MSRASSCEATHWVLPLSMTDQQTELAWAAGFFDSEGVVVGRRGRPHLQVKHPVRAPLDRLRRCLNGTVVGPYFEIKDHSLKGTEVSEHWYWVAQGETALAAALTLSRLSTCKREELQAMF